jgi:hypothetical protein
MCWEGYEISTQVGGRLSQSGPKLHDMCIDYGPRRYLGEGDRVRTLRPLVLQGRKGLVRPASVTPSMIPRVLGNYRPPVL